MSELEERKLQTKVKHEILSEYLIKWGSIITSGLVGNYIKFPSLKAKANVRFTYIDYFSFQGIYTENGKIVYGSPIIGIQRLDEIKANFVQKTGGVVPTTTVLLFEEKPANYKRLLETLESKGYSARIKKGDEIRGLKDGDIAVFKADSSQYFDRVIKHLGAIDYTYSFHFVDPYGTADIKRSNIKSIISLERADCIINMMVNSIYRRMGACLKDNPNATEKSYITNFDDFYGSDVWRRIANDNAHGVITKEEAEDALVGAYYQVLKASDSELAIKNIPLKFQDKDETVYHLFLTTHDPTGALTMNEILDKAKARDYDYRKAHDRLKHFGAVMGLGGEFSTLVDSKRPTEPEPNIDFLSDLIFSLCRKRVMNFKAVLHLLVDDVFYEKDIKEALGKLKKKGRASFEVAPSDLKVTSEITFE